MKTKGFAALAMLIIMASALAVNFGLACEQGDPGCPIPIEGGNEECLAALETLVEAYEVDCPPIKVLTADICIYIWTATDTQTDLDTTPTMVKNLRVTYSVDETGTPIVDVQELEIPCDGCGDFLKRKVINFNEEEDSVKEEAVEALILCLIGDTELPIVRVEAEVCLRIVDMCCDVTIEKWLVTIENGEVYTVEARLFEWHEIIMNNIAFEGILGTCRGNEMEIKYEGPGQYENGYDDVHFYLVYKVGDGIRDLQAHIELVKVGPCNYLMEIYHSINSGNFELVLPFDFTIVTETPYFMAVSLTCDLC